MVEGRGDGGFLNGAFYNLQTPEASGEVEIVMSGRVVTDCRIQVTETASDYRG